MCTTFNTHAQLTMEVAELECPPSRDHHDFGPVHDIPTQRGGGGGDGSQVSHCLSVGARA